MVAIGSRKGEVLIYDPVKQLPYMTQTFREELVNQITVLPPGIDSETRKSVFYVLTEKNLYCCKRQKNCFDSQQNIIRRSTSGTPSRSPVKNTSVETTNPQMLHINSTFEIDQPIPMSDSSMTASRQFNDPADGHHTMSNTMLKNSTLSMENLKLTSMIMQQFYKSDSSAAELSSPNVSKASLQIGDIFPQILKIGFLQMEGNYSLAILIDPGVFQLVDPFSLQPFYAMTIPHSHFSFLEHMKIHNNRLIGFNDRQLLVVELD